ncbi:MAG: sporulation membrane protein YtaF [Negativicutes bacterium]|nr:sporulation membrane protein YtaF [Negativicutes bacterium]
MTSLETYYAEYKFERERSVVQMDWLVILGLATSSSLDNFGVGIAYGIRNIRISWVSNLVIAAICFMFSMAGIFSGLWIAKVLPGLFPTLIGAFLLFIIGLRIILLAVPRKKQATNRESAPLTGHTTNIIEMLEYPEIADADKSGEISFGESIMLGIALSANALTNGLGAGLLGLSPFAISLTAAIGSFITVWTGALLGKKVTHVRIGSFTLGEAGTALSGIILIVIAAETFF